MSDEEYRHIFEKKLNYYMQKNNLTQIDVATDLNLKTSTVSSWCTGQKLPRMDKIQLLADDFGLNKSDLIEDKAESSPEEQELQEYLEELRTRPEMKMLFSLSKKATKEEVEQAVRIIEALRGDQRG